MNRWRPHGGREGNVIGESLERRVIDVLEKLQSEGVLESFKFHPLRPGADFTIVVNEQRIVFDVTASNRSWKKKVSRSGHPPSLYFPAETTTEQIEERILSLFQ